LPGAVVGLAPHSLRAATIGEISKILPLREDGPVHIHIAEQTREVDDCVAWSGRRPVQYLLDSTQIDHSWCLVHATHMDAAETARLAASGAVAGLCPITEANLGDGIFPARDYASAGGRFGVGSDSNILIDAAGELRQLEYSQRLALRQRNVLATEEVRSCGRLLFDSGREGGARACGVAAGQIAAGHAADLVSLDLRDLGLSARHGDALLDLIAQRFRRTLEVLTG
jgi:formiminoglutamate deiminase